MNPSFLLGLAILLCAVAWPAPAAARPLLESEYVHWPPAIQVRAPVDGVYMLIRHDPDDLDRHAMLRAGDVARFPLERPGVAYHVQVMRDPAASFVMLETVRHRRAAAVYFFPWVSN